MFLRNPIFCLLNQFLLNQCCAPSMVQFANMRTLFGEKEFECTKCKATFKKKISVLDVLMLFLYLTFNLK